MKEIAHNIREKRYKSVYTVILIYVHKKEKDNRCYLYRLKDTS